MHIITDDSQCPIRPDDINGNRNFLGTIWRQMESEVSAAWLVKFAHRRGSWKPFTRSELEAFYHEKRPAGERFWFNKLIDSQDPGNSHIQILDKDDDDETFAFTTEFVAAVYMVSPNLTRVEG